jgi:RNA polymerase primary sigma factor
MLSERERKIIELRYGIHDGNARTLAEIAKSLGVSRERVRQIEAATIKKIRHIIKQKEQERKSEQ